MWLQASNSVGCSWEDIQSCMPSVTVTCLVLALTKEGLLYTQQIVEKANQHRKS